MFVLSYRVLLQPKHVSYSAPGGISDLFYWSPDVGTKDVAPSSPVFGQWIRRTYVAHIPEHNNKRYSSGCRFFLCYDSPHPLAAARYPLPVRQLAEGEGNDKFLQANEASEAKTIAPRTAVSLPVQFLG